MERLALSEPTAIYQDFVVDDSNLEDYLKVWDHSVIKGKLHFAPTFDLEKFEPYLRELHEAEQLGFVYHEKERGIYDESDLEKYQSPGLRSIEKLRREMWTQILQEEVPVEKSRSIYMKKEDEDNVYITPLTFGEFTRGETLTFDLLADGHTPLLEVHSHPFNRLFSALDYQRLIWDFSGFGHERAIRGLIVVCPEVQILALATPKTLYIPGDQVPQFVATYDLDQSERLQRILEISNQLGAWVNSPYRNWMKLFIEYDKTVREEEVFYEKGLYTKEELEAFVKNKLAQRYRADIDAIFNEYHNKTPEVVIPLKDERASIYNALDLQVAKDVNPKLYLATDFRHFREFEI